MLKAQDDIREYLIEALKGTINPYDKGLFGLPRAIPKSSQNDWELRYNFVII
jgi:hypothetical protein